jgi:ABC-type multidrug transport system permease subunit
VQLVSSTILIYYDARSTKHYTRMYLHTYTRGLVLLDYILFLVFTSSFSFFCCFLQCCCRRRRRRRRRCRRHHHHCYPCYY